MVECGPLGDRADVELVGDAVGQPLTPRVASLDVEVPVSVRADRTDPLPTLGAITDLCLESLADVLWLRSSHDPNHTTGYTELIDAVERAA